MLLTILFVLLVLFVIALLFVPIQVYANTDTSEYYFRIKGLAKANLEPDQKELLRIRFKTFFFERSFYPLKKKSKTKKTTKHKTKRKRKVRVKSIIRVLRSFEVRRFKLDIDTGDYTVNAKLYPVFLLLNRYVASFHINFLDRNILVVDMRNRPYKIIKSFINN